MIISERIRELRESKELSQGDVEEKTGLLRCYLSRIENGHTVPSLETLQKLAKAFEVPLYFLFYDGEKPPTALPRNNEQDAALYGKTRREKSYLVKLRRSLGEMEAGKRELILKFAEGLAKQQKS